MRKAKRTLNIESLEDRKLLTVTTAQQIINLDDFRAEHPNINGTGQAIAIIDNGFDVDSPAFGSRVKFAYDFVDHDTDLSPSGPNQGFASHGTFVASIAAGEPVNANNGNFLGGIAPDADIILLRAAGGGATYDGAVIDALNWVAENAHEYNISTVNLSLASSTANVGSETYELALRRLAGLDVITVAAAGNWYQGTQGVVQPASDRYTIPVGSVDNATQISSISQRHEGEVGGELRAGLRTVMAPGKNIQTMDINGNVSMTSTQTSWATPAVAGSALLAQQYAENVLGRRLSTREMQDLFDDTGNSVTGNGTYSVIDIDAMADRIDQLGSASGSVQRYGDTVWLAGTNSSDSIEAMDFNGLYLFRVNSQVKVYPKSEINSVVIDGRAGNDSIRADITVDYNLPTSIFGGSGNDVIRGGEGEDFIRGGSGHDTLVGGKTDNDWPDVLEGGIGNDTIDPGGMLGIIPAQLQTLFEPDLIVFQSETGNTGEYLGTDTVSVNSGVSTWFELDLSSFGYKANVNLGTYSTQTVNSQNPNALKLNLSGSTVLSSIRGTRFNDMLTGDHLPNVLDGGSGNDTLRGMDGTDVLYGRDGLDLLLGGNGNDELHGGRGGDWLDGGAGADKLYGYASFENSDDAVDVFITDNVDQVFSSVSDGDIVI